MLVLPPEVTHAQAGACLQLVLQGMQAESGSQVVIDCAALSAFDSSVLAVLLECRRAAIQRNQGLVVKALPQALGGLARLYGVQELLPAIE